MSGIIEKLKNLKRTKIINFFFLLGFSLSLVSCNQNEIFYHYNSLPAKGWAKDSLLSFDFTVKDIAPKYNILIQVRHYGTYPYQNLWLFLENKNPKDSIAVKDTIEFYLADEYGKWLGTGVGALKEMPVLYKQQIHFTDTGSYQIKIGQGMRDSLLRGVERIGLRVEVAD